jgi:Activator of Hsp90 ATPase homolog 1-like protein
MKKIENVTQINAPATKVWQVLTDEKYYLQWYEAFGSGSKAISDWQQGSKIIFADDNGMGLIGTIVVFNPGKEFRIQMKGLLVEGVEDYDSPDAKVLGLAEERYVLEEENGITTLRTSADMDEGWFDAMNASWTEALKKIKGLSEAIS